MLLLSNRSKLGLVASPKYMNYNMKITTLSLFFLVLMNSCHGQTRSLAKNILRLENFDFSTPVSTLLPADTKDSSYDDVYNVKNTSLQKFVSRENDYTDEGKPLWYEYRQFSSRSSDELARYDDFVFNTFNMVVSLEEEIIVFNAIASDLTKQESDQFIELLTKKYGSAEQTEGEFMDSYEIYTWKLKDRILKYVPLYDDESNTLKIAIDQENKTLEEGEKRPHYRVLFYVINAKYSDLVIGNFHTGDLLYCN